MTLQEITAELILAGFTARSKVHFRKWPVDVEIKDAFLSLKYPALINMPPAFIRVKIYSEGNEHYIQLDCPLDSFQVFENSGL